MSTTEENTTNECVKWHCRQSKRSRQVLTLLKNWEIQFLYEIAIQMG